VDDKLKRLVDLVCEMREAQKKYFRCRQQSVLLDAKSKEAKVDKFLKELKEGQGNLFE